MIPISEQLLQETTASVLADCAFLMLDPVAQLPQFQGDAVVTTLGFSGSARGALRLCAPRQLLIGAAADMLGQPREELEAPEHAEAALAELANVLLGVLLARAFGTSHSPLVGLPTCQHTTGVQTGEDALCSAVLVDMEGLPFVASILPAPGAA